MSDSNLPWKFLGRQIRPYSFGVAYLCAVYFVFNIFVGQSVGTIFDDQSHIALTVGSFSLICFVILVSGWWVKSDRLMRLGLLLSTGIFAARGAFVVIELGFAQLSAWVSLGLVIMSGGAWLLEKTASRTNGSIRRDSE